MNGKSDFLKLMAPGKIGSLALKNRIVMPAMGTRFCGVWGEVNETIIEYYRRRARGGCGLIMVEVTQAATAIDPLRVFHDMRADDQCYIPGLNLLAEAVHEEGAKIGIQLSAGGGFQAHGGPWTPGFQEISGTPAVSPSGMYFGERAVKPRILTTEEIHLIVQQFGRSASYVKSAGFDLIEIHAHGGYLIHQFLSPFFNKRTDEYGGSFENRIRFLMEIVNSVRNAIGANMPLQVKFSIEDFMPDGWDIKQSTELAKKLEAAGVNSLVASSGIHKAKMPATPPYVYPQKIYISFAEALKKVVKIPVMVGGRINNPDMAEKALAEGKTDFIMEGRAVIADPDWAQKVKNGESNDIRPCIACNSCRQRGHEMKQIRCTVNAVTGRETKYNDIVPAGVKKKVLIIGGGPAGMEAARVAALRGHEVILCERNGSLGGKMVLGGIHNEQITHFNKWMINQIMKLPVEVKLKTNVTPSLVKKLSPDVVIIATGAEFAAPQFSGVTNDNVINYHDLMDLMHGIPAIKGILRDLSASAIDSTILRENLISKLSNKRIVIIGGQFIGCSLALLLAERGLKMTILEETDHIGNSMEENTMTVLKNHITANNVKVMTSVKVTEITDKGVVITDASNHNAQIECDFSFIALDLVPATSKLEEELNEESRRLITIGDAKSARRILESISDGFMSAYNL